MIKTTIEDFVVDEIPAYEPSGEGDHLFVRFTKRGLTTDEAVRRIGHALGIAVRDIGVAGQKDKIGVTTQTVSLPCPLKDASLEPKVMGLSDGSITILSAKRHGNKLKTAHLDGNRFAITVRGIDPDRVLDVRASFDRIAKEGVPNAFGVQRFGREGDNADRAKLWLTGKAPPPRDPRKRRFLWSSLQSAIFNAVLDARVERGTWAAPVIGDWVRRCDSGGLFLCTDVQVDGERAAKGEVSPTGPIVGVKMRWAEGAPGDLEREVSEQMLGEGFDLAATRALGEGTRRALRLWVSELRVEIGEQETSCRVYFVLPKGAYATTVLGHVFHVHQAQLSEDSAQNHAGPDF